MSESPDAYALMVVKTQTSATLRQAFPPQTHGNSNFLGAALAAGAHLGGSTINQWTTDNNRRRSLAAALG
jgi:hypothetical protein